LELVTGLQLGAGARIDPDAMVELGGAIYEPRLLNRLVEVAVFLGLFELGLDLRQLLLQPSIFVPQRQDEFDAFEPCEHTTMANVLDAHVGVVGVEVESTLDDSLLTLWSGIADDLQVGMVRLELLDGLQHGAVVGVVAGVFYVADYWAHGLAPFLMRGGELLRRAVWRAPVLSIQYSVFRKPVDQYSRIQTSRVTAHNSVTESSRTEGPVTGYPVLGIQNK
jgi:hypothetical protein